MLLTGVVGSGALYAYDELVMCEVMQRSLRAAYCGAAIFVEYKFIWTPYNASDVHTRVAKRIVETCKQNEGLYVKFGQVMGSLELAMPKEFRGPLSELHDKAKTFDTKTVYNILKEELKEEDLARIKDISALPVASASVAQVHTAIMDDGRKVAVKVQKPNIRVQNQWDLYMYKIILTLLEYSFDIPLIWTFDYVKQQLESELDFTIEAENATSCRESFAKSRKCCDVAYVPETYISSKRVIVSEWIENAVKITDIDKITDMGLNAQKVVHDATNMFAFQIFGSGSVHCDPHPGNLLVRVSPDANSKQQNWWSWLFDWKLWVRSDDTSTVKPHQVVLIDHGLYVHFNPQLKKEYIDFWMAMIYGDDEKLSEQCKKWGIHDSQLFASMTLMRRRKRKLKKSPTTFDIDLFSDGVGSRYENEEGEDRRSGAHRKRGNNDEMSIKERAEKMVEKQRMLKERVKNLLQDTSEFPHEIGFVNRGVNYIRATNWTHGSPVDRIAIFATAAARASAGDNGMLGEWSLSSELSVWKMRSQVLWELWNWFMTTPTQSAISLPPSQKTSIWN